MNQSSKKLNNLSTILNQISISILEQIRNQGIDSVLDYSTEDLYRDSFKRVDINKSLLKPWEDQINTDELSVEIITTMKDDTEIHYHKDAYAVLTILGEWEGTKEPDGSVYYFGSSEQAFPAKSKITLQAIPGTIHGFRSPSNANPLIFLSVQSKKIDEDFHVVKS